MARSKVGTPPRYRHHKSRDLAKVTVNRRDIYLGKFNSPESHSNYAIVLHSLKQGLDVDAIKARLNGAQQQQHDGNDPRFTPPITVGRLTQRYWTDHAADYFKSSTGLSRGRVANVRVALRAVNDLYVDLPAREFGTLEFRNVRARLVARSLSRRYINDTMRYVIDLFRWGVEFDLVPFSTPAALREVKPLRKDKSDAIETEPVTAVDPADVEATLPELQPVLQDMVRFQLLTGARPIEVCVIKFAEISFRTDGTWCYTPSKHKTQYRGRDRRLFLGPQAQAVLQPYMLKRDSEYVFTHRWKGEPKPYVRENYTQAIKRACKRAGLKPWTSNQLRHLRATTIRRDHGLELAQVVLGHSRADVTEIYAEQNFDKAAELQARIG